MELRKMQQSTFNLKVSHISCSTPRDDYNIQTTIEYALMQSVTLADQPGDTMSHHTVPNFFTHTDSNSVPVKAIFLNYHY